MQGLSPVDYKAWISVGLLLSCSLAHAQSATVAPANPATATTQQSAPAAATMPAPAAAAAPLTSSTRNAAAPAAVTAATSPAPAAANNNTSVVMPPMPAAPLTPSARLSAAAPPPPSASQPTVPAISVAPLAPVAAIAIAPDTHFPRYDVLKPAVNFWTRVFGEYSELQSVVHSTQYPNRVYTVLDFRAQALTTDKFTLDRERRVAEQDAKDDFDRVLKAVDAKRYAPQSMNSEERRVFDLYADLPGEDKYRKLIGTARVQRGLKERTDKALETSNRYLPSMEQTFTGHGLPTTLTRLPLVESSFNLDAYSKAGAAGIWQFIPSSARIYMRLNEVVDDRRDPWTSTDAAARHLKDDYELLQDWPLAITAYNYGRGGVSRALNSVDGRSLPDLIERFQSDRFGFASRNYYAEFLAAVDVERAYRARADAAAARSNGPPLEFETVETKNYVPYETLRRLCGASDESFQRLNPAYRPEVIEGKLYVPPGHLIRVPYGSARSFEVGYAKLGDHERFDSQRAFYLLHKVAKGENLGKIARQYGVAQDAVLKVNTLKSAHALRVGQVLKIPPRREQRPGPITVAVGESTPSQTLEQKIAERTASERDNAAAQKHNKKKPTTVRTHKVQEGQTLSTIARRYKVSVNALRDANNLSESSTLHIGQKLKVPG